MKIAKQRELKKKEQKRERIGETIARKYRRENCLKSAEKTELSEECREERTRMANMEQEVNYY